jgi:hypothetical protein
MTAVADAGATTPRVYTEEDWNDAAVKMIEEKGAEAGVFVMYSASKVLSEKGELVNHSPPQIPLRRRG